MSFYKPSYGSSISFQAKNLEWRGINGELNLSPLGVNSIRADLNLIYIQNEPRTIGLIKKVNRITTTKGSAGQKEFDGIVNSVNFVPESQTENRQNFTADLSITGFDGDYSLQSEPDSLITQSRQIITFEDGSNLYVDFDYQNDQLSKEIFYVDGFTQNYQYLEGYYLEYPKRNDILSLDFVEFFTPNQNQEMGAISVTTGASIQNFGLSYIVSGDSGLIENFTGSYFLMQNEDFSGYLNIDNLNKSIQYLGQIDSWFLFDFSKNGVETISGYTSFDKYGKSNTDKIFFNNYFPNSGFYLVDLNKIDTDPLLNKFTGYSPKNDFESLDGEQFTIQSETGINDINIDTVLFTIYSKDNSENKKIYYDYRENKFFAYDLANYPPEKAEIPNGFSLFSGEEFVFYDNFYNSFEGSQIMDCSVRDISDDVFETTINLMNNRVAPILKNGLGFIKDRTLEISTGVSNIEKNDIYKIQGIESGLDFNFYAVENNSVVFDQNKLNTLFTDLTKTGIYEGLTRSFPFHPDQRIDLVYDHSKRVNEFKNSFIQQLNVGFNQNRIQPIEFAFSNRTDKEAYAILHFLEAHLGYRKFAFLNKQNILDTEINETKFFFCPTWKHNFNYKDSNTIEATFVEVIDPII